jgi:hypothetical protein
MNNRKTFGVILVVGAALGLFGCSSSSGGEAGSGGTGGGTGGNGGMGSDGAMVTAVHLAPEVPAPGDTEVAIFVNGDNSDVTIAYGESTGRIPLAAGTYDIGIGLPDGDTPLLELMDVELNDGDDLTVVAYRTNDTLPVDVFVFSNSTDGLAAGSGRVFVGHGANDPALDPVNISTSNEDGTADCTTLIPDFAFGTTFPADGVADLPAGSVNVGFDVTADMDACPQVGPVPVPVTDGVVSILVAVDENTSNDPNELAPELWAIVDPFEAPLRLINTQ